jgi:hypothetical protein
MAKPTAKRVATAADLMSKPARIKEVPLSLGDDDLVIKLKAIGSKAYDDKLAEHPPTKAQKADGATYNMDTFPVALLSLCMVDPVMTEEELATVWTSPEWSRGELLDLFFSAVEINNKGLNVPFNEPA